MKKVRRPNITPPSLKAGSKADQETERRAKAFEKNARTKITRGTFPDYWGGPDVRGALWAMHGRSCAYCDRDLPGTDRGDVEHFRPKNVYWWLAYVFRNYLL